MKWKQVIDIMQDVSAVAQGALPLVSDTGDLIRSFAKSVK
jgi:hypothetical protein